MFGNTSFTVLIFVVPVHFPRHGPEVRSLPSPRGSRRLSILSPVRKNDIGQMLMKGTARGEHDPLVELGMAAGGLRDIKGQGTISAYIAAASIAFGIGIV